MELSGRERGRGGYKADGKREIKQGLTSHPLSPLPYKYAEGVLYGEGGRKFEFCVRVK